MTGAIGNEGVVILSDTGSANLTSITIGKLGSTDDNGQPITVTYSDGSTLTPNRQAVNDDGTNRNEVLNNDEVVYNVNLDITNPGQITLVFTMPANSTISEASVSSANGCLQGSKVGQQSIVGSDGESSPSYTNNQATCVINPGSAKSLTWSVSTNPWGGDGEQIRPSLTISGRAPTGQLSQSTPVVTTIGRGDYGITVYTEATNSAANGLDRTIYPSFGIYGKKADQTGALGLAPLSSDGDWVLRVNTSNLPAGWTVASTSSNFREVAGSGGGKDEMVHSGQVKATKISDDWLEIRWTGNVTAVSHCPSQKTSGEKLPDGVCYYMGAGVNIGSPVSSLTPTMKDYSIEVPDATANLRHSGDTIMEASPRTYSWTMTNKAYGHPVIWAAGPLSLVGWDTFWDSSARPVYGGQAAWVGLYLSQNTVPTSDRATDLYYCATWNPSVMQLAQGFVKAVPGQDSAGVILADYAVEYGVIGANTNTTYSSSQGTCGKYGDGKASFFTSLSQANEYAAEHGLMVNAIRLWSAETKSGVRVGRLGKLLFRPTTAATLDGGIINVRMYSSGVTNEWNQRYIGSTTSSDASQPWNKSLAPGLLSHSITAEPSSAAPNSEDHITITPTTYNRDTNVRITTTLPSGLTPKENSFKVTVGYEADGQAITRQLVRGENIDDSDYIIDDSGDETVVTFNLDHISDTYGVAITGYDPIDPGQSGIVNIVNQDGVWLEQTKRNDTDYPLAADNDGNGIVHSNTPISFDVIIDSDVATPSNLVIESNVSGTGTSLASATFRSAKASVAVATEREFGYSLSASASEIYAGDDLSYVISNHNSLDDAVGDLATVNVLPYTGDSRGTTGLSDVAPYVVTDIRIHQGGSSNRQVSYDDLEFFYATDTQARQLERADPTKLVDDSEVAWRKINLDSNSAGDDQLSVTLPDDACPSGGTDCIVAFMVKKRSLGSGESLTLSYRLTDIVAGNGGSGLIGNSINYTYADVIPVPATNVASTTTRYLGSELSLILDKSTLSTTLEPGATDTLTNTITLNARTSRGYNLTMQGNTANGELVGDNDRLIPTIAKPGDDLAGNDGRWAVRVQGSNNLAEIPNSNTRLPIPGQAQPPLSLYSTTIPGLDSDRQLTAIYEVLAGPNSIAGNYRATITYTLTAEL